MLRTELDALFDDILNSRRLLAHRFYRRWEAGGLEPGELASYAGQYRHFEAVLPVVLEGIADRLPEGRARSLVMANLDDELGVPAPHLELFDSFASAVGAPVSEPTAATGGLIDLYTSLVERSPVAALSAVAAYEVQSPSIAASKAAGLLAWYGLDADGTRFWDVHAGVDEMHGSWMLDALGALTDEVDEVAGPATAAADAWWAFLDEREAAAPTASAGC
ncbi:MAG TPA: iron-containing redox enzyme family protein [Acidimicrobiales bacterium]|nr:iron-containing redox enzyme family protein [Acidimicrobiales bacterium]